VIGRSRTCYTIDDLLAKSEGGKKHSIFKEAYATTVVVDKISGAKTELVVTVYLDIFEVR